MFATQKKYTQPYHEARQNIEITILVFPQCKDQKAITTRLTDNPVDIPNKGRRLSMDARIENFHAGSSADGMTMGLGS